MYDTIQSHLETILTGVNSLQTENPEIELRLGHIKNQNFETNIGYTAFDNILKALLEAKCWCHVSGPIQSTDYFTNDHNRLTEYENSKEKTKIQKQRLGVVNVENECEDEGEGEGEENTALDVRISVCAEVPIEITEIDFQKEIQKSMYKRSKKRWSFVYKNIWRYDCTVVNTYNVNSVNNPETQYEIEMELLNPKNLALVYTPQYLAHSAILKINDLICLADGSFFEDEEDEAIEMQNNMESLTV